jgi:hypothetical protein
MSVLRGALLLASCAAVQPVLAHCAAGIDTLRRIATDPLFPLRWVETGMGDGKPLVLSIDERAGLLHLRFEKTGEGFWAEGPGRVCVEGGQLTTRFEGGALRPGPAAPWLLRQSLAAGASVELDRPSPGVLVVSTPGWRGRFAPRDGAVTRR